MLREIDPLVLAYVRRAGACGAIHIGHHIPEYDRDLWLRYLLVAHLVGKTHQKDAPLIDNPFALINILWATFTLGAYVGLKGLGSRVLGGGGEGRRREMSE